MLRSLLGSVLRFFTRRRARGHDLAGLAARLEASGERIASRMAAARDTPGNREAMNHIIGIERWGQSRLRVALDAPFQRDAYHGYRLPDDAGLADLRAAFEETRSGTVALARELADAGVQPTRAVRHNDLGELTLIEWLVYLEDHANRERHRIRTGER